MLSADLANAHLAFRATSLGCRSLNLDLPRLLLLEVVLVVVLDLRRLLSRPLLAFRF